MRQLNQKTGDVYDVPDPYELPDWRRMVAAVPDEDMDAEPISFTQVESAYFKAEYALREGHVVLHVTETGDGISEEELGGAMQMAFGRTSFPGDYTPELKSWALRVDDPPTDWENRVMEALQLLEDSFEL